MRNIPGLLGLVLMLLALMETKSGQQQSFNSDNGLRIEFNNTEKLREVNIGNMHILTFNIHTIPIYKKIS